MVNIENLKIQNFRTFDSIEIDGLSKINVFVGKNNSGKTTILESLFLIMGMSNPTLPFNVNVLRGLHANSPKQLTYLFHKLIPENKPSFYATFNDQSERTLTLEATYKDDVFARNNASTLAMGTSLLDPEIMGLNLKFSVKKGGEQTLNGVSSMAFENNVPTAKEARDYRENLYSVFVLPDKNDMATFVRYSELFKKKEHEPILKSLQQFDPDIKNVLPLDDGIYFDVKGIDKLVPVAVMGDGVRQFLRILTAVSERREALVFIDEIENGLHYSAHVLLWEKLVDCADKSNIQFFIATHNIEILSALSAVLQKNEYESVRDYINIFLVANTLKAGYKTYQYSYEGLQDAIECNVELRR
jgi:AAA15 family ATPase/GTPase